MGRLQSPRRNRDEAAESVVHTRTHQDFNGAAEGRAWPEALARVAQRSPGIRWVRGGRSARGRPLRHDARRNPPVYGVPFVRCGAVHDARTRPGARVAVPVSVMRWVERTGDFASHSGVVLQFRPGIAGGEGWLSLGARCLIGQHPVQAPRQILEPLTPVGQLLEVAQVLGYGFTGMTETPATGSRSRVEPQTRRAP
jgi:hypothetical protein